MGYILEFKDDFEKQEVIDRLHQLKEDICEICEMLEDADPEGEQEQIDERGSRMIRRSARMRDERMMRSSEGMNYRRGRNGRYM